MWMCSLPVLLFDNFSGIHLGQTYEVTRIKLHFLVLSLSNSVCFIWVWRRDLKMLQYSMVQAMLSPYECAPVYQMQRIVILTLRKFYILACDFEINIVIKSALTYAYHASAKSGQTNPHSLIQPNTPWDTTWLEKTTYSWQDGLHAYQCH